MIRRSYLSILCIILIGISVVPSLLAGSAEHLEKEKTPQASDFTYKLCYFGSIENLVVNEDEVSFDAVNLWRLSRIRSTDGSYWDISLTHYEDVHHYLEGYRFRGILRDSFIWGRFTK